MLTFWCDPRTRSGSVGSHSTGDMSESEAVAKEASQEDAGAGTDKRRRLVKWNVDLFSKLLQDVIQHRHEAAMVGDVNSLKSDLLDTTAGSDETKPQSSTTDGSPEIEIDNAAAPNIDPQALQQLEQLINQVSLKFQDIPFHNF
jgi:hypothetical protein